MLRCVSFWIDSTKSDVCCGAALLFAAVLFSPLLPVEDAPNGCVCAGRRARESEKAGDGKTVNALARMLVVVSGWRR